MPEAIAPEPEIAWRDSRSPVRDLPSIYPRDRWVGGSVLCATAVSTAVNFPKYSMSRYNARTSSSRAATARGDMSISSWIIIVGPLELGEIES